MCNCITTLNQVLTLMSSEVFQKRGWLEMQTESGQKYYLVKNRMLLVPDKTLPRVSQKDLEKLKDVEGEERDLLITALGIFKGKLL